MDKTPLAVKEDIIKFYDQLPDSYIDIYADDYSGYPSEKKRLEIVLNIIRNAESVLEIGCGPCIPMIRMLEAGCEVRGVDYSPEMIKAGQRELEKRGYNKNIVSLGDVENFDSLPDNLFDAVSAIGVFFHLNKDELALTNINRKLKPGGVAAIEFRNDLFSLFSLNQYSYEFYLERLINLDGFSQELKEKTKEIFAQKFDILTQQRENWKSTQIKNGILQKFHNPLNISNLFDHCGFEVKDIYFYHYHCLPPALEKGAEGGFYEKSYELEDTRDWRGYFMASAFVVEALKK